MAGYTRRLLKLKEVLNGTRAFTVQPFTEANVALGVQYEATWYNDTVAPGDTNSFIFKTGAKPAIIKSRTKGFTCTAITAGLYKNPTGFSGTPTTEGIYNLNEINPVPTTVTILPNAVVSTPGTQVRANIRIFGAEGVGNRAIGSLDAQGLEFICLPNTTYVITTKNESLSACEIANYITWYEGPIDLPSGDD